MSEAPVVEQAVAPVLGDGADTGGPVRTSLVWATWALFVGLGVMVAGAGLYATTIGIRAEGEGFPTVAIGAMSAGYYLGFLAGSRAALYVLTTVGHIRVYTALAALLTVIILVSGLLVHPAAWIALRLLAGACLAGQYVVAESWLNQIVTNAQRARVLGFYTLVTVVPYGIGQLGVGVLDPTTLTIFAVAAILISLAVTPVSLSAAAAPPLHLSNEKMTLRELFRLVPTGVVTSLLVGIAHGAFIGLGAVYAARVGLSTAEIGLFVTMPTLGSLLLQVPIASASDRIDRRIVGALSAGVAAAGALGLLIHGADSPFGLAAMVLIGGTTYPLYSIAGAYTNDWVPAERLTAVAAQLVLVYGAGAFVGPLLASVVMGVVGDEGYVWTALVAHLTIAGYLAIRVAQAPTGVRAKPWNDVALTERALYVPATVASMGRRLRRTSRAPRRRPRVGTRRH
ncbi:MAG: MFS transporter [Acidimicrobiaceae bacterium]|nr:MFS transporter [Acidimicrobiaceae bacterium]